MKEIFNNLAFKSTLVYQSITKKHCWLFSQTQRTKRFLFVSETLYLWKLNLYYSQPIFQFLTLFFHSLQLLCLFHINIIFLAISFLYFSEYLIKLIFSFEVLESKGWIIWIWICISHIHVWKLPFIFQWLAIQVDYSKMLNICSTISSPGSISCFNSPLFVNTGSGTVPLVWLSILDCLSQSRRTLVVILLDLWPVLQTDFLLYFASLSRIENISNTSRGHK